MARCWWRGVWPGVERPALPVLNKSASLTAVGCRRAGALAQLDSASEPEAELRSRYWRRPFRAQSVLSHSRNRRESLDGSGHKPSVFRTLRTERDRMDRSPVA